MSLIATPGADTANSYVATLAEARTIVETVLRPMAFLGIDFDGWDGAQDTVQENALKFAVQRTDRVNMLGMPVSLNQARAFPRVRTTLPGIDNTIPDAAKWAQVAEACFLLSAPDELAAAVGKGLSSFALGQKQAAFSAAALNEAANSTTSKAALEILRSAGLATTGAGWIPVGRS